MFLLAFSGPAFGAETAAKKDAPKGEETWDARVTRVSGQVKVAMAQTPEGGEVDAKADMPLSDGDRVTTGKDGRAEIAFEGESAVELGPNSKVEVESTAKNGTSLRMKAGYLLAKIKFMLNRRFRVRTPTSVSAVRGTEFAVEIADEATGKTVVGVFDKGKLAVSQGAEESEQAPIVTEGQEIECPKDEPIGPVRKLEFLKKREEQVKQFRERVAMLREQYKKYTRENRERYRENLRGMLRDIEEKRKNSNRPMTPEDERKIKDAERDMRGGMDKKPQEPADDMKKEFERSQREMGKEKQELKQKLDRRGKKKGRRK
ncbi:MAG: FecR domain-containing protein [Elusimicrobiota bacterium]